MNQQLLLSNIRNVLIRLEETILFALIERAQFKRNLTIYDAAAFPDATAGESLVDYLLHETERIHARLRRYTSPDEYPFFEDLPAPILPELRCDENPLRGRLVNLNWQVRQTYESYAVPLICAPGDDQQYGSCAVCDVACLQALSKRIHYGMFVAESKYLETPARFDAFIDVGDTESIGAAITEEAVEQQVLARIERKAANYLSEVNSHTVAQLITPETIAKMYRDWIIPATKDVEVEYLLRRNQ